MAALVEDSERDDLSADGAQMPSIQPSSAPRTSASAASLTIPVLTIGRIDGQIIREAIQKSGEQVMV